jgi:imidazole glycerol-phosphate synthase subunit HisH
VVTSVSLVNYGVGNICAFENIYRRLDVKVHIATTPDEILSAEKLVLPGVGAFDWAMHRLNASGMRESLDTAVLKNNVPILGICVGMQMMAKDSEEGETPGLGWLDAKVVKLRPVSNLDTPIPHMGWNEVQPTDQNDLFNGISSSRYYFLHSFVIRPRESNTVLATTEYRDNFVSAIRHNNVFGTQFHPEKSHKWGISLLKNFAGLE